MALKQRCCQYCGQTLPETGLGARLTPFKARVFDTVQRAGVDGISAEDLFSIAFYDHPRDVKRTCLKSHIMQINDAIEDSGYKIIGSGSYYRLVNENERGRTAATHHCAA